MKGESFQLIVERYKSKNGIYPERVLVDKIYRNRKNLAYCKENNIKISGSALGRPKKDETVDKRKNTLIFVIETLLKVK